MIARSTDSGIDTAVTSVARTDSRKPRITRTAKTNPRNPSRVRSWIDARMNGAWSSTTVTVALRAAPPSISVMRGSAPRISSDTATVLASAFFDTPMPVLGTPLVRVYPVAGAGAAVIVAMSPSRTGVVAAAPVGGVSSAGGLTRPPGETGARGVAPARGDTAARGEGLEAAFGAG